MQHAIYAAFCAGHLAAHSRSGHGQQPAGLPRDSLWDLISLCKGHLPECGMRFLLAPSACAAVTALHLSPALQAMPASAGITCSCCHRYSGCWWCSASCDLCT